MKEESQFIKIIKLMFLLLILIIGAEISYLFLLRCSSGSKKNVTDNYQLINKKKADLITSLLNIPKNRAEAKVIIKQEGKISDLQKEKINNLEHFIITLIDEDGRYKGKIILTEKNDNIFIIKAGKKEPLKAYEIEKGNYFSHLYQYDIIEEKEVNEIIIKK